MPPVPMWRGAERWLAGYLLSLLRRRRSSGVRHLLLCMADHFEPFGRTVLPNGAPSGGCPAADALRSVRSWCEAYTRVTGDFRDADGRSPRHTFFYPWDEYDPDVLDELSGFCRGGGGEIEIHLHHRGDTAEQLRRTLDACRDTYAGRHGLLGRAVAKGAVRYGFVHGNWALCNARPDGDWCGVHQELEVLLATGCYADFTFPSAPSPTQPRHVNMAYYGDDPEAGRRGHRFLRQARAGAVAPHEKSLLFIPGPLGLNWGSRRYGLLPRLENGEISAVHPASAQRLSLWIRLQVHVAGRPDWLLVKLHTHGMSARSRDAVTGPAMHRFHEMLQQRCRESNGCLVLHYVTARELYNIVRAAEAGASGDPGPYRDYEINSPPGTGAR